MPKAGASTNTKATVNIQTLTRATAKPLILSYQQSSYAGASTSTKATVNIQTLTRATAKSPLFSLFIRNF
jgi:hypothetical protein